jgi:CRISPR-associated endonuclease/helicase Cas3
MISGIKAKSDGETLEEHTNKCLHIFSYLKEIFPGLDYFLNYPDFFEEVYTALFFHDFGKAASGFQKSLETKESWGYRHEILSVPFVNFLKKDDLTFIKLLILTHHKDINDLMKYIEDEYFIGKSYVDRIAELNENINGLNSFLEKYPEYFRKTFGKEKYKISRIDEISNTKEWEQIVLTIQKNIKLREKNRYLSKIGIFGKGMVNACDYLASGGLDNVLFPTRNITNVFNFPSLNSIQKQCLLIKDNALLISPTGSGKTEAALFWATKNLDESGGNRIFYSLPYTASLNAMYLRLLERFKIEYSTDEFISLLHGKSSYYLYKLYDEEDFKRIKNIVKKIYSPYKILTPYQCLKHLFSIKGFEMGFLEMYRGRFIFDEIHSYDPRTVALILSMCKYLLEEFDTKILIMSATLPTFLREMIADLLNITTQIKMEQKELSKYLRHRCEILEGDIFDHIDKIKSRLKNERVLVVCNTVSHAQQVYAQLKTESSNPILLHGRFILRDREEKEKLLEKADLLIGTQTIEVSLDIDYDVCFSEPAPLDALLQRFGRVNRRKDDNGFPKKGICDVFIFTKGSKNDKYIYEESLVEKTLDELNNINLLYEDAVSSAVDRVYSEGFGKKQEEFDQTKNLFEKIIKNIIPFQNSNRKESDFYKLITSVEAVPACFKKEYMNQIQNGQIFEAMQYCLQISTNQYHRLLKEDRIDYDHMVFVNAKYDTSLGLLIDQSDPELKSDNIV